MPIARQKAAQLRVEAAPIVNQPSALRTAWYGAFTWWAEPRGRGISPVAKYLPASHTPSETPASKRLTSMCCPRPVRSRARSAETAASAPYSAQTRSQTGTPTLTGSPPGIPVMLIRPLRAWAMMSRPASGLSGPSCPQPDAAT